MTVELTGRCSSEHCANFELHVSYSNTDRSVDPERVLSQWKLNAVLLKNFSGDEGLVHFIGPIINARPALVPIPK